MEVAGKKRISNGRKPTAAIAIFQTVGVLNGILDADIGVPEQLSFVTFDYSIETYGDALRPPIAAMYESNRLFGNASIEALIDMMNDENGPAPFKYVKLPMLFRKNDSCQPVKTHYRKTRGAA